MKSAYSRQFALIASLILISFLLLGVAFVTLSYRYTMQTQLATLEENASFIGEFTATYRAQNGNIHTAGFQSYVYSLANISKAHVLLCETDGEIVYSADGIGQGGLDGLVGATLSQASIRQLAEAGEYSRLGTLGGLYSEKRYIVGEPIVLRDVRGETVIGYVFMSSPTEDMTELWRSLSGIFSITAAAVALVAFLLTSVTTKRQTKPLKEMAATVQRFGHGEFDARMSDADAQRPDEMGELARAFNSMADSLAQAEQRRSEFVANISHELKTPMTTIAGYADGILDGTVPPQGERAALETISSETRRLSRLVRQMLDVSRLRAGEGNGVQEQFDIVECTARVLVSLERKVSGKKLDVVAQFPEEPVKVWGGPDAITQVLYNLLDNAIKFSREGGHLWVEITPQGGKARVSIRDEGETIPPAELPLIFDRFHKSDKSRSMDRDGVGLGLYIVKAILNEHKENITVQSENGVTEFAFTLTLV